MRQERPETGGIARQEHRAEAPLAVQNAPGRGGLERGLELGRQLFGRTGLGTVDRLPILPLLFEARQRRGGEKEGAFAPFGRQPLQRQFGGLQFRTQGSGRAGKNPKPVNARSGQQTGEQNRDEKSAGSHGNKYPERKVLSDALSPRQLQVKKWQRRQELPF